MGLTNNTHWGCVMAERWLALPSEIVKKSNAIIRGRWTPLSVWEPRIVALVASKVRADDEDFFTYRIPVAELTGVSDENLSGDQYREIRTAILALLKAQIRIQGQGRNFQAYTIFSKVGYEHGELIAGFHPDLKQHFLKLKANFTAYSLFEFLSLPSTYSQKLFELIKSLSRLAEYEIPLAELHEILGVPKSFKANFGEFRRRVLEPAQKHISLHTSLVYRWEPVKVGRAVVAVRFLFAGGHRALAAAESQKHKYKREHKQKLHTSRMARAIECAQAKGGACHEQTSPRIVCKLCQRYKICAEFRYLSGNPNDLRAFLRALAKSKPKD